MKTSYDSSIDKRRSRLAQYLKDSMQHVVQHGLEVWNNREKLDSTLQACFNSNPILKRSNLLYALDVKGNQISSQIYPDRLEPEFFGQDLSLRPYFLGERPIQGIRLSSIYVNKLDGHSCISVVKAVRSEDNRLDDQGELLGYIVADFSLLSLPNENETTEDRRIWLQIKGDPSIRSTVFMQSRSLSLMDESIDDTISTVEELLQSRGIFHAKLHFSSSRATLWLYDDPYHYRVHPQEELNNTCLAYPARPYPKDAVVSPDQIPQIFEQFKTLRFADDTVYLRAASLNIINGMVALNFSCDGSHYIPAEEFLNKGEMFWLGSK
jgi:hypothetical protein